MTKDPEAKTRERGSDEAGEPEEQAAEKPSWRRRLRSYAVEGAILILVLWGITWYQSRHLVGTSEAAPGFTLRSLEGEEVSLEAQRGKTVVLYFFAPWCSVCHHVSKNVVALRRARPEGDLAIYAVGLGYESRRDLERFARDQGLNVPVLLGDARVQSAYRIQSFPTVYFVDEDGQVQDRVVGYTTELGMRLRAL